MQLTAFIIFLIKFSSKLKSKREERFTQDEFAHLLGMETSNYNRRENGITKIVKREWDAMQNCFIVL